MSPVTTPLSQTQALNDWPLPSDTALIAVDPDAKVVDFNDVAQRWLPGLHRQKTRLTPHWFAEAGLQLCDRQQRPLRVDELLAHGHPTDAVVGLGNMDQWRWLKWRCLNGTPQLLVLTDVSDLLDDIQRLSQKAEEADTRDIATGLYNRRYVMERLDQMHHHAKRYHSSFAVSMIDIDHFKRINDTFGHNFGDRVLERIAQVIRRGFRETDLTARYGGEEFLILMPETSTRDAILTLDRLRQQVSEMKWDKMQRPVTISSGVISWQPNKSIEQLIFLADQRLRTAKNAGRNQVCGDLI